jgi:hypothetical protein
MNNTIVIGLKTTPARSQQRRRSPAQARPHWLLPRVRRLRMMRKTLSKRLSQASRGWRCGVSFAKRGEEIGEWRGHVPQTQDREIHCGNRDPKEQAAKREARHPGIVTESRGGLATARVSDSVDGEGSCGGMLQQLPNDCATTAWTDPAVSP